MAKVGMGKTGDFYVRAGRRHGMLVEERSKHTKIIAPDGSWTLVPRHNSLSRGVELSIIKFLLKFGVALTFTALAAYAVIALG